MPNNILAEPVYRFSYRCAQNLCKGQIKAARDNMITWSNLGKDNPAKAKLKSAIAILWQTHKTGLASSVLPL